jgi:hypothetical protein
MHYNDPERAKVNSRPAYGTPAIAPPPALTVRPLEAGKVEVGAMLALSGNTFQWYAFVCFWYDLEVVLFEYTEAPEAFFKNRFSYEPPVVRETPLPKPKRSLSAAAYVLGLDLSDLFS